MSIDLVSFTAHVPGGGFQWLDAQDLEDREGRFLTNGPMQFNRPPSGRQYEPLAQEPGLFRVLADIEPTETAVLDFANSYGCLGGEIAACIQIPEAHPPEHRVIYQQVPGKDDCEQDQIVPITLGPRGSRVMGAGETLKAWRREIEELRSLVELWESSKTGNPRLNELIRWHGSTGVRYEPTGFWIAAAEYRNEVLSLFTPYDLAGPARFYASECVNQKLRTHKVHSRLVWQPRVGRPSLQMVPESLIGCIWLQLARAIDGDRQYRKCPECAKWFEITSSVSRSDRLFCTTSCKASGHRKKVSRARELAAAGVALKEIARILATETKTVKGWIKT